MAGTVQITLRVYDSSGLEQRRLSAGMSAQAIAALQLSSDPYDPAQGPLVLSDGTWSFSFDGRDGQGEVLRNGAYVFEIESLPLGGSASVVRRTVQVVGSGVPTVLVLAGPNPLRPGDKTLYIQWKPSVPVDLKVYNLDGELVRDLGRQTASPATWDLQGQGGSPVANGIYWVSARRPGERQPRLFKLLLAR